MTRTSPRVTGLFPHVARGPSSVDKANMTHYVSVVGYPLTAWTDEAVSIYEAKKAMNAGRWQRFEKKVDHAVAKLDTAQVNMALTRPPASMSTYHEALVRRIGQQLRSAKRFRTAYRKYVRAPTASAAAEAKLQSLWNAYADDGIACSTTVKMWANALGRASSGMDIQRPEWISTMLSKMQQAL